jgi:3'-5' exoribonuclease
VRRGKGHGAERPAGPVRLAEWLARATPADAAQRAGTGAGGGDAPWTPVASLREGDAHAGCYCVGSVQTLRTKTDKPYLKVQLSDRTGTLEGRVWDDAERLAPLLAAGTFVGVRGRVEVFAGVTQLRVEEVAPVTVEPEELAHFLPRSPYDPDAMGRELDRLVAGIGDPELRAVAARLLDGDAAVGRAFRAAPAAKHNHHAYLGGLLEHSLSVAFLCDALARHYGDLVDRDLLVTGALLHDIGKIREIATTAGFPYTDEGKLLGHILLGLDMVRDAAREVGGHGAALDGQRLELLLHLVASHQGRHEWQSPREPRTLEALLLHYADDLDAKMNQAAALVRAVDGDGWSAYDRGFGREFLRHAATAPRPAGPTPAPDPAQEPAAEEPAAEEPAAEMPAAEEPAAEEPAAEMPPDPVGEPWPFDAVEHDPARRPAPESAPGAEGAEGAEAPHEAEDVTPPAATPADATPEEQQRPGRPPDTLDLFR